MTTAYRPLLYPLPELDNLRDLGGRPAADGRPIKRGLLLRSAELSRCRERELRFLEELGIKLVVDFRDLDEREARPDRLPAGADYVHLPALPLSWAQEPVPDSALLPQLFRSDLHRFFLTFYRILANSEESAGVYREFFRLLLREPARPLLWHCTQGKDRAGVAAILLQTALGVSWESCVEDYFLTNDMIADRLQRQLDGLGPEDGQRLRLLNLVQRDCIEGWREQLTIRWGGLEEYLETALELDAGCRQRLRDLYLQADGAAGPTA